MPISNVVQSWVRALRALPSPVNLDGQDALPRGGRYGETIVELRSPKPHGLADEGSYFVATNPTPGTGLATIAAQASLADTAPFILLTNTNPVNGKRIYLDYLRFIATAAGTAGTQLRWAVKTDTSLTRYTSGGSVITPNNVNQDDSTSSKAVIQAGALVATAASAAVRLLGNGMFRPVIPVVADVYQLSFGGIDNPLPSVVTTGTAQASVCQNTHPVIVGPGQCAAIHIWLPSQSAASSYEFELGYWER